MQQNKVWLVLCLMVGLPFLIPMFLPEPFATFGTVIMCISMILLIRKFAGKVAQGLLTSKMVWVCSACQKQHNRNECPRCGSRQRKLL